MDSRGYPMPPPPKGILKNKSRDEGSRYKEDDWENSRRNVSDNNGGHKFDSSDSGSSRSLRHKLNEFISRKGELLFRPLSTDEVPLKDEKGTHRTTQDHYGVVPALDYFLSLDLSSRKRHFFNSVREGELLIASLTSRTLPGLQLKVICMEGGRTLILDDLEIEAFCPTNQMVPPVDPKNPNRIYAAGDFVRCEILKVTVDTERLVVGMKGNLLSPELSHSYQLGLIFEHELPPDYVIAARERSARDKKSYEEILEKSVGFQNPNNIVHLASSMGILSHKSTLMAGLSGIFPAKEMGKELRRLQNGKWAHGSVAEGIKYFKSGNYTEAFQCLNKAISIDAENVEGLVARGALYANKASFEKAIEDFESALRFNPSHYNARKYLAETLVAFGKQQEASGQVDDAVATYSKCLAVRPDHEVAKEALWAVYARTEKLDVTQMSGAVAAKTVELREKLKLLLQEDIMAVKSSELANKNDKPRKSKRKSRKDSSESDSDSSNSSSSESESNSSSSDSDSKGKRKKKSKRKKSKKSKKHKKEPVKEKEKERSLSPFSKRLAQHGAAAAGISHPSGSDLVGFNQSTYADWGKRVGVAAVGSDEEEKKHKKERKKSRKSKEKRKKKKRGSESSSESDSSEEESKRKRKKAQENTGVVQAVLPDLGDLEAKLTAYYSKVEQEKASLVKPSESASSNSHKHSRDSGSKGASDSQHRSHDKHERSHENRDNKTKTEQQLQGQGFTLGKIQLNTDQYGNFIHPEKIMRTVVNDTIEDSKPKFEMKFRAQGAQGVPPPATGGSAKPDETHPPEIGSKWRKVGIPSAPDEPYVVTRLDGTTVIRKESDLLSKPPLGPRAALGIDHTISNPLENDEASKGRDKEEPRNYRSRKSRSRSRSRSKSPRGRRSRRSRTRSRSRGRRSSRSSGSRSRSRSRSPGYRSRRYMGRGRRFFRGFRNERGGGGRGFYRGRGGYRPPHSRMRNVFRSRSRSRGRDSKSRSRSPRRREDHSRSRSYDRDPKRVEHRRSDRERRGSSKSDTKREPEVVTLGDDASSGNPAPSTSEIQIGGLTTTNAKDVEELLDQRNAQKKEEMKERNPDFFRAN